MKNNLISECYKKSIELLIKNSAKNGIIASTPDKKSRKRNYNNIFGRDASICALGMAASKNKTLIDSAKKGLISLGNFQSANGQIPYYVNPPEKRSDFWYLGCVDSTLWWLLAVYCYDIYSGDKNKLNKKLAVKIKKAIGWLECQEHPKFYLLQQNEASDWADIMPRSGFILYSNALWHWVKKFYKLKNAEETKENFNYLFYPWQKIPARYFIKNHRAKRLINYIKQNKQKNCLLSFVNFSFWGEDEDVYGNMLACLAGLTNKKQTKKIIEYFIAKKANFPYPIKSCLKPILKNSKNWRDYMNNHNLNFPNQYHNGGIWPFIGGFWILMLYKQGKKSLAEKELAKLAIANKINSWQFNEWLHGKTGKPMGMAGQSWNAGMFLLAYHYLKGDIKI